MSDDLEATADHLETLLHTQIEKRKEMEQTLSTLEERVDRLEAEKERLRERADTPDDKAGKVKQIVEFATNKPEEDDRAVKLTATDIKAAPPLPAVTSSYCSNSPTIFSRRPDLFPFGRRKHLQQNR